MSEKFTFHFKKFGQGKETLILLHGFSERKEMWDEFCEKLQVQLLDFSIYTIDIPGFGECPLFPSINSLSDVSEYLKEFLDTINIKNAHFAGHSMGGYILLDFVVQYPQLVKKLCLINSSIFADNELKKATRDRTVKFISHYGSEKFVNSFFPELFSDKVKNRVAIENMIALGNTISKESLIAYMNFMKERPDQSRKLIDIEIPIHFLIGKNDQSIPFDISIRQISIPRISSALIFNDSAHMLIFENQSDSINSISSFFEEHN